MFDGTLPLTDGELERALIALVLADNSTLDHLGKLTPDDLADPILAATLEAALDLHREKRPVNLVTMKARLGGMPVDDHRTGLDVVRSLSFGAAMPDVRDIVHRLRSLAVRRRLASYLGAIAQSMAEESSGATALAADAIQQLNGFLSDAVETEHTAFNLHDAAQEFLAWVQSDGDPVEIPTGLKSLDDATGGWHRGQFAILAGRPSMGKSTIALSSMLRTAAKGYGVLFFSLEMTKQQLVARALTDFAYTKPAIAYSDLKPGTRTDFVTGEVVNRVSSAQMRRLEEAAARFKGMPIEIETKSGLTAADILGQTRRWAETMRKRGTPLALVVVDHLLKVVPSGRYAGQSVKELDEVSEAMCVMAKSLDVAVLGLHQLNRQVESRDNPRPVMSDLRGSGSLEQDADVIMFAYRPAYQYERQAQEPDKKVEAQMVAEELKHDLELQIAKQRNGPTRLIELYCDMAANVVRDKDFNR